MVEYSQHNLAGFISREVEREFNGPEDLREPKLNSDYETLSVKVSHLNFGPNVTRIKIWNDKKVVVWSDEKRLVGKHFPTNHHLIQAIRGAVVGEIAELDKSENQFENKSKTMEIYVPVWLDANKAAPVVFEVYFEMEGLCTNIEKQEKIVWIAIAGFIGILHLTFFSILFLIRRESREN